MSSKPETSDSLKTKRVNSDSEACSSAKRKKRNKHVVKEKDKSKKRKHKEKKKKKKSRHRNASEGEPNCDIPLDLMEKSKAMTPMTKEQWEKEQSVVKRVLDRSTGRYRLIKGGGEVLEEIVSRNRHKEINKQATKGDGEHFQAVLAKKV